jgi:6-phosphogluconolactonase
MKFIFFTLFLFVIVSSSGQQSNNNQAEKYLLIGTYTSGKSEGIYVYKFNTKTGEFKFVSTAKADNPSFLAVAPTEKFVYAVNENGDDKGSIAAYSFDKKSGTLTYLNKQPSGGDHPCFVSIDSKGKWVVCGNYTGGSLALLPVNVNGALAPAKQVIKHEGHSVNKDRQEKPHVHSTNFSPDYKYLFVPDLGIDKVMIYSFDSNKGELQPANPAFVQTKPGTGPRHFAFHPSGKYAYLMEEMGGTVEAFAYDKHGGLKSIQTISSMPSNYAGSVGSADIHVSPDGKFLYASNRDESNTIAIFSIGEDGKLKLLGHQSTLGKTPRNFNFDPSGNFLVVANQNSDNIVIYKINKQTGMLTPLPNQIQVPNPVCIKWTSY